MAQFLGDRIATAVKVPCTAPALDDVLAVDPADPKVGIWKKAGTDNIANAAITTVKINDSAVTAQKVAARVLTNEHLSDDIVQGHGLLNKFLGASNPLDDAPAGFNMLGGAVFKTDIVKDTTTHRAGFCALTFVSSCAVNKGFESELIPVREGELVEGLVGFEASGTSVFFAAVMTFYQRDKTTVVGSVTDVFRGNVAAATTNYTKRAAIAAPANARYVKIGITITASAANTLTIDTLNVVSTPFGAFTGIMPIGSIVAWHKTLTGVPTLPVGWVQCDGQTLSDKDSALDGQVIPDLNGSGGATANRFLRGAATSGTTRADNVRQHTHDMTHGHTLDAEGGAQSGSHCNLQTTITRTAVSGLVNDFSGSTGNYPTSAGSPNETYPRHMDVVWIMRVK